MVRSFLKRLGDDLRMVTLKVVVFLSFGGISGQESVRFREFGERIQANPSRACHVARDDSCPGEATVGLPLVNEIRFANPMPTRCGLKQSFWRDRLGIGGRR